MGSDRSSQSTCTRAFKSTVAILVVIALVIAILHYTTGQSMPAMLKTYDPSSYFGISLRNTSSTPIQETGTGEVPENIGQGVVSIDAEKWNQLSSTVERLRAIAETYDPSFKIPNKANKTTQG